LFEIAKIEGSGSQDLKVSKTASLLNKLDPLSAKYVVRIILGTTRLGFTELTVIAALSKYINDEKDHSEELEATYSIHPDIGLITKTIKENGIKGIKSIQIEPSVPILSQKCQRLTDPEEILEKMQTAWAEFKFDGTRVQLHMDKNNTNFVGKSNQENLFEMGETRFLTKTFTRNQEETTLQYPDLIEAAHKQLKADSIIIDGEAIGYDKKTGAFLPFQEIMQRKRKHGVAEMVKDIPLKYFVFDILYLNGESLVDKTLLERRQILEKVVMQGDTIIVDSHLETDDAEELNEFFEEAKEKGLEGVIIKNPESVYQAGARSFSWIKWKKMDTKLLTDTVDCVILGYWTGKGMRTEFGIGKFLAGIYDKNTDKFVSLTKVGTGLKEDDFTFL
jgi:DNA ligase-1